MATLLAGGDARDAKGSAALDKGWHPDQPLHDGRRPGPRLVRQANDPDQQGPCLFDIAGALGALRPVRLPQGEVKDHLEPGLSTEPAPTLSAPGIFRA